MCRFEAFRTCFFLEELESAWYTSRIQGSLRRPPRHLGSSPTLPSDCFSQDRMGQDLYLYLTYARHVQLRKKRMWQLVKIFQKALQPTKSTDVYKSNYLLFTRMNNMTAYPTIETERNSCMKSALPIAYRVSVSSEWNVAVDVLATSADKRPQLEMYPPSMRAACRDPSTDHCRHESVPYCGNENSFSFPSPEFLIATTKCVVMSLRTSVAWRLL